MLSPSLLPTSVVNHCDEIMVVTADHGAHNAYNDRILYRMDLFDAIENKFGTDVILNDPNKGNPFYDMIYLDSDLLKSGGYTPEDVADFVEETFPDHVYHVITKGEIFCRHRNSELIPHTMESVSCGN